MGTVILIIVAILLLLAAFLLIRTFLFIRKASDSTADDLPAVELAPLTLDHGWLLQQLSQRPVSPGRRQ